MSLPFSDFNYSDFNSNVSKFYAKKKARMVLIPYKKPYGILTNVLNTERALIEIP